MNYRILLGCVPLELRGTEISLLPFMEGLAANSKNILVKHVHKHEGGFLNEKESSNTVGVRFDFCLVFVALFWLLGFASDGIFVAVTH